MLTNIFCQIRIAYQHQDFGRIEGATLLLHRGRKGPFNTFFKKIQKAFYQILWMDHYEGYQKF